MLPSMSLAVVGAAHLNQDKSNRRFEIMLCCAGDPIELRLEPKNHADPRAVAVFSSRGVQIGYLTAERCGRIGSLIRAGMDVRAVFQMSTAFGAWIRVSFDGSDPVLSEQARRTPDDDQDFLRDDVWPED